MNGAKLYLGRSVAHRSDTKLGAALILTLACIVILTALVLIFFSHALLETQVSVASADQTAANLFARGAVDSVVGELKQEITAGSVATFSPTGSDLRDPNTIFLPATNQAMVPYRMDPAAPANVLKRSAYNEPFYSGSFYNTSTWPAPQWAVNFSSTNPGTGGRYISMQRWNEPLLMPTASSTSTNLMPAGFVPPDWVYVTRTAGPATTWSPTLIPNTIAGTLNADTVVGRYAYVVYDEGGLLDANVAGYPNSVSPTQVRHKISEACADLTQIGLTSGDINTLVTWRNPTNSSSATQYTNYVYSMCTNAFLTPMINGSVTERLFTSRQQLITFLTQNVAQNAGDIERMQGALPYLTTFSRELNAPTWYPQTNMATAGYSYLTVATNTPASATNAFTPIERAGSMYTNLSGLVCGPNQPATFSRFPLSRLSWLTTNGPPANVTSQQVQEAFGLSWDGPRNAWKYYGPSPNSSVQSSILPLNQIKGREPNFFELLKAGLLSGSINLEPQAGYGSFPSPGDFDTRYGMTDEQTVQIGLNIIDQASVYPLPTRVEFGANTGTSTLNGEDMALYGTKNLPLIYKMVVAYYRPTSIGADSAGNAQAYFSAWAEPVFWSPYLSSTTNTAPMEVRIRADSTNTTYTGFYVNTLAAGTGNTTDTRTGSPFLPCGGPTGSTSAGGTGGATIELDAANAATLQNATVNPILFNSLLGSGAITSPPNINDLRAASPWPGGPANADYDTTESTGTYAGFWLGIAAAANQSSDPHASTNAAPFQTAVFSHGQKSPAAARDDHEFVLEANYGPVSTPTFLEVQRMTYKYWAQSPTQVETSDNFTTGNRRLTLMTFIDPRTGRFSFDFMNPTDYVNDGADPVTATDISEWSSTTFPSSSNPFTGKILNTPVASTSLNILPALSAAPTSVNAAQDTFRFADNSTATYGNQNPGYFDTDGAQRNGDAWWSSTTLNTMPTREDSGSIQFRPVILNRPFYSVGELGYVYRDMPWRSLDVGDANSADAGLLDYFCINEGYGGSTNAPVVAGVLNLNTAHPQVLQAMLNGAARAELFPAWDINSADATSIANSFTNVTSAVPLINKSELATRLAPNDPTITSPTVDTATSDSHIKEEREASVRALASVGQVRTWNLMIDVVAQTGHLPPNATGFNNFNVTAEQRYWAHVAIDRYTGQVISMQLEPVSE